MQSLSVLVLMACCGALAASPSRPRRSLALPEGIPLEEVFAACGEGSGSADIGPCVETLLAGVIDLAKPNFASGIEVGGKTVVLEPLSLKDIPERPQKKFRFSARNLKVHGLSSLHVQDVTLLPDRLALELRFSQLKATTRMGIRYLIFTGSPDVELTLRQPRIRIEAGYSLVAVDGKLGLQLSNPTVGLEIASFSTKIGRLGGLGAFLSNFLNSNNQVLLDIFQPEMERQAQRMLEKEFKKFKLVN